ncbi:MAG TPA: metallophosphoesterase, partial [Fervidobacterium sp.]|nr:metallophosphoesterase [Fervidobacterium sp.]
MISDLHHPFFSKNIEAIFKEITSIKPAHVFMLGDLTELGKDSEFESLKKSLATLNDSTIKYDMLLGNHDTRWSSKIRKTKELGKALYENYRVDIQDIAFIGIDTSMYFEQLGHIGEEQMNWIKEQMELSKRDGKIAILMSHHPLIPASSNVDDSWKLLNLLDAYNVPVALAGHVHKYSDGKLHNGTFFQTVGGARDGWMTVVSWDTKYIYMWKYNSTDHYSGYSLIAKVAREYNERFDQKISFNSSNQGTITQFTIETKNIKELNVYMNQKLVK